MKWYKKIWPIYCGLICNGLILLLLTVSSNFSALPIIKLIIIGYFVILVIPMGFRLGELLGDLFEKLPIKASIR
jgi:hypothetical protein